MGSNGNQEPYIIVVGVDYSGVSHLALCEALRLAGERREAEVHVLHVTDVLQAQPLLHRSLEQERELALQRLDRLIEGELAIQRSQRKLTNESNAPRVVAHLRVHRPGKEIAQLALDLNADLVVVGTHGRTGISRLLLGSVAHAVVTLSPCPVLVVRPKDGSRAEVPLVPRCIACEQLRAQTKRRQLWCKEHATERDREQEPGATPYAPETAVHGFQPTLVERG
jgi:nucleotide-binding universal stress UspA family protein